MNNFVQEDWERVHLLDTVYIKEMEFQEQERMFKEKPSAKITATINFKKLTKRTLKYGTNKPRRKTFTSVKRFEKNRRF